MISTPTTLETDVPEEKLEGIFFFSNGTSSHIHWPAIFAHSHVKYQSLRHSFIIPLDYVFMGLVFFLVFLGAAFFFFFFFWLL